MVSCISFPKSPQHKFLWTIWRCVFFWACRGTWIIIHPGCKSRDSWCLEKCWSSHLVCDSSHHFLWFAEDMLICFLFIFPSIGNLLKSTLLGNLWWNHVKSYLFLVVRSANLNKCHLAIPEVDGAAGDDEDSAPHGQGRVGDPAAADSSCPRGIWSPHFLGKV